MTLYDCFWSVTAPASRTFLNKSLPERTEVVVIGGGYTGTSAALQLAKHGVRVTLLEAKNVGWGASSRNGGQALSCLHHTLTRSIKIHGRELAREMFLAAVQAANNIEEIIAEERIECDYVRCGNIEAASKPAHFDDLKREQETLAEVADYQVELLPKSEMVSELATGAYHGLMINPRSGSVHPAKLIQGLALAAERAGADIHEGTRVFGIERTSGSPAHGGRGFKVRTKRGDIFTKEVLLAANAWVGEIVPQFRRRVVPVESFVIATEPLSPDLANRLIPRDRVAYDTRSALAYFRLSPDRRMIWGGELTFTGAHPRININALRRGMIKVFPELHNLKIDYFWSGTLGLTLDESAHAGQMDGMWFSMCYVGHGVTLATYLGRQMANGILGKAINNPFANLHMPPVRFLQDNPMLGNLGKAWYGFLDLLG